MKKDNRRGFSLIELLAVIVILGILTSIVTFSVSSIKKKQDVKNCENVVKGLLVVARKYAEKNPGVLSDLSSSNFVELNVLKLESAGLVSSEELINPIDNAKIESNITIESCDSNLKKIKFSYKNICGSDGFIDDGGCDQQ